MERTNSGDTILYFKRKKWIADCSQAKGCARSFAIVVHSPRHRDQTRWVAPEQAEAVPEVQPPQRMRRCPYWLQPPSTFAPVLHLMIGG